MDALIVVLAAVLGAALAFAYVVRRSAAKPFPPHLALIIVYALLGSILGGAAASLVTAILFRVL